MQIGMIGLGRMDRRIRICLVHAAAALAAALLCTVPARAENPNGIAVIIGNKDYSGTTPDVLYADNDARAMRAFVVEVLGFPERNVFLIDNATHLQLVNWFGSDRAPRGELAERAALLGGAAEIVVFYSGHGVPFPLAHDQARGHLLPVDANPQRLNEQSVYPLDLLQQNLARIPARSITVYLDACFSGNSAAGGLLGVSATYQVLPRESPNLTMVTATDRGQVAFWDGDARLGLFTRYLLDGLRGGADGAGAGNGDGRVTAREAKAFLDREMSGRALARFGSRQDALLAGPADVVLAVLPAAPQQAVAAPTPAPAPTAPAGPQVAVGVFTRNHGDVFRDCAECPELVVVPAGRFTMGSPANEVGREGGEGPQRTVTIARAFAVGKYEVTFAEWDACVAGGGCGGYRPSDEGWGRGRQPVINVNWDDAKSYLAWLSQRTGQTYRLLSEAEWEYVARAGTTTRYWWGNDIGRGNANCSGCGTPYNGQTAPVGSFRANAFGLHDMLGNVWEWVEDCWHNSYTGAPADGTAWTTNCSTAARVLRGGSWISLPGNLRSAFRSRFTTVIRNNVDGFRVARTL
ncbi:MAG: hypothetical protein FJX64_10415 [Alphaproteobacteria bacterium]|nr:hypothetical protein [Alphaproteobacteria bacterium]